jgi:hypothetical protein
MKIVILLLLFSTQVYSQLSKLQKSYELPAIDVATEMAKSTQNSGKGRPLQYAIQTDIKDVYLAANNSKGGQWDQLNDGSWLWRFEVHAENAKSLDFGLYDFYLPPTASLSFYDWNNQLVKGLFTDQKNKPHKQLWPGPIIGNKVRVELHVADKYKKYVSFSIKKISRGFRSIWQDVDVIPKNGQQKFWIDNDDEFEIKSGSCNVDVVCDEGDAWRDQIRSVARYLHSGVSLCTGQMINNAANDGKPLFLTANHCGLDSSNDASINIWWNYESNQCRTVGSTASGISIPIGTFNDTQSGSTFKASFANSDFALVELDDRPSPNYNVFYTGWDRRDRAPTTAVGIHHPQGHAKRISFENNPTTIVGNVQIPSIPLSNRSHIQIGDWDLGTTEGGSSGSGIWSEQKLLMGVLSGGSAACGNDAPDFYGRLFISWEGGGASNSRLKDWLDPNNSGVQTLQGLGDCSAMTITVNHSSSNDAVGVLQNFSVNVTGGTAPYSYQWDVNGDQEFDGSGQNMSATYTQQYVGNVSVNIVDSEGCTGAGSTALVIEAPRVNLLNAGAATQMCGNGNATIDPGERWRVPVTMQNNGFQTATGAYAVFTKGAAGASVNITTNDNFGNGAGSCDRQFIDISNSGTELTIVDSDPDDSFPANDEGVAAVNLSQPFNLYGQTINSLHLSTNGYISTDPTESGFDFDNDCPLPQLPNNSNNGSSAKARIIPLHDDLITQHIYHQHFNVCPRQSELGQDLSCDVFMYNDVDLFDNGNNITEHFNFEAILYPTVNQWVYQYDGEGINSGSSSVGIQNDNGTDGVSFSCNQAGGINTQQAVCVYHRDNQSEQGSDNSFINLETPLINMGNLQVSQQNNGFVEFSIAENAVCDSAVKLQMQAAVYDAGFNTDGSTVINTVLGNNGICSVVNNCAPDSSNDIAATNGLWFNSRRSGNGNDMYFTDDNLVYLQYTANPDRSPVWYITADGSRQNNQAYNDLLHFSHNGPFLTSPRTIVKVGESVTTLINADKAVQTRTINGQFSADILESFIFAAGPTPQQRTGLWFYPVESGWGGTVGTQGDTEVLIIYLYDNAGQPYWTLGSGANAAVEDIELLYFNAFCPHCPSVPVQSFPVGSMRVNYNGSNISATVQDININVNNGEHDSQWNRTNIPWNLLTAPLE